MSAPTNRLVETFVDRVRRQLNFKRLVNSAVTALLVGAGAMLVIALAYVVQGYAVARQWYVIVGALAGAGALATWWLTRYSPERATAFADRFFGLKDALITYLHARQSQRGDGFYALQSQQAAARVQSLDAKQIDCRPPRRQLWLAIALTAVSLLLALKKPSDAVQQRLAFEDATQSATLEYQQQLEELVRELDKQLDDPLERELVDPDQLRRWVKELRATKDQKEALRQFARLEQRLNKARNKLRQQHDEQLLERAAKELDKGRQTEPLAKKLEQKDYEKAAEQMQDWKPAGDKPFSQQQRELARLKAAAQRMAAAARNSQRGQSSSAGSASASQNGASQSTAGGSGKGGGQASGSSSGGGGELEQAIEQLAGAIDKWDDALDKAVRQEKRSGKCDADTKGLCEQCSTCTGDQLGKLSNYLKRMAIKRRADQKLGKLCLACSQCQGGLCQCSGANPGGKKAGWGSNTARRNQQDELLDNGQTTPLTGIKGAGPSLTTVEAADEGDGAASRGRSDRVRTYRRQFESFVSREDVPQEVKAGVKRYFQYIHQIDSPTTP